MKNQINGNAAMPPKTKEEASVEKRIRNIAFLSYSKELNGPEIRKICFEVLEILARIFPPAGKCSKFERGIMMLVTHSIAIAAGMYIGARLLLWNMDHSVSGL